MTHKTQYFRGASVAALAFVAGIGWTVAEAVTATRHFEGQLTVVEGVKQPDGTWKLIDEATARLTLDANVLEVAGSGKQVTTGYVWSARSKNGRSFSIRLAGPGDARVDLQQGVLELIDLPFEVTLGGRKLDLPTTLSTERVVTGPTGTIRGRRFTVKEGRAPVLLVGATQFTDADDGLKAGDAGAQKGGLYSGVARVNRQLAGAGSAVDLLIIVDGVVSAR